MSSVSRGSRAERAPEFFLLRGRSREQCRHSALVSGPLNIDERVDRGVFVRDRESRHVSVVEACRLRERSEGIRR
jgi:hypothetical protein